MEFNAFKTLLFLSLRAVGCIKEETRVFSWAVSAISSSWADGVGGWVEGVDPSDSTRLMQHTNYSLYVIIIFGPHIC